MRRSQHFAMCGKSIIFGCRFPLVMGFALTVFPLHVAAADLTSRFFQGAPCAASVLAGTPYDMADPGWRTPVSYQNRDVCAYKFFAALHMLGYNTERNSYPGAFDPHLQTLRFFENQYGFPVTNYVTRDLLLKLDDLLALREQKIAAVARAFPLYDHMQPLHPNDISKDWVAYIYTLPMLVLPAYLQLSADETVQCINGQCLGFIQDAAGNPWPTWPVDLNQDYRFVGAYFDPRRQNSRMPSAAVDASTVLHEYAHYLDGQGSKAPRYPHRASIETRGFYDISYDMSRASRSCAPPRSSNSKDWVTRYGFLGSYPPGVCPVGMSPISEEFAEAFMMYGVAGKNFRAAAQQNVTIAQKYAWLKQNVFQGIEYDTDLQQGYHSGCNDIPGTQGHQPGYASCSWSYVWDGELRSLSLPPRPPAKFEVR